MHIEENGNITPCCVMPSNIFFVGKGIDDYLQSDKLAEIKNYFKRDEQHPYCSFCWDAERNGIRSQRATDKTILTSLRKIHIRYNNICNFKCRMCNPKYSSTWEEENKQHNYFKHEYTRVKDIFEEVPDLFTLILKNKHSLEQINISGGEPFIADANLRFLDWLIENKLTNITLAYSTNLSKLEHKGRDLLELLNKFDKVILSVSVDGYGKAVEYSRYGFKWNIFENNIQKIKHLITNLVCVVNIYSVYSIPQLQYFAKKNKFNISYQPCLYPQFLSIQSLPIKEKLQIQKFYDNVKQAGHLYNYSAIKTHILDYMFAEQLDTYSVGEVTYNCNQNFKLFNSMLDTYRKENFIKVFPQYSGWYKEIK